MTLSTSNLQMLVRSRLLRMILSVALVFAALHVSSHELYISNDGGSTQDCQVCHLNKIPFDTPPDFTWVLPLLLLSSILLISAHSQPTQIYRHILGARAPPLF